MASTSEDTLMTGVDSVNSCPDGDETAEKSFVRVYLSLPTKSDDPGVTLTYPDLEHPDQSRRFHGLECCLLASEIMEIASFKLLEDPNRYASPEERQDLLQYYINGLRRYSRVAEVTWSPLSSRDLDRSRDRNRIEEPPFDFASQSIHRRIIGLTGLSKSECAHQGHFIRRCKARLKQVEDGLASESQVSAEHKSAVDLVTL